MNEVTISCHGYQIIHGQCTDKDINECEDANPCGTGGVCQNTIGSFEYVINNLFKRRDIAKIYIH